MRRTPLPLAACALALSLAACGARPTPSPESPVTPPESAEAAETAPEDRETAPADETPTRPATSIGPPIVAPPPAPAPRFADPAPAGWSVERIERGGTPPKAVIIALAGERPEPDDPASRPAGRISLARGTQVLVQQPLAELLDLPDAEAWHLEVSELSLEPHRLTIVSVLGATGEDYREVTDETVVLTITADGITRLWSGPGGTLRSAMGICVSGTHREVALTADALVFSFTAKARWSGGTPEEDWEKEIKAECVKPSDVPPEVRIPLPSR